jgi:hypothetical protein
MDGINLAEAKEKEAEAWKNSMADRTKKEKERMGEFQKAFDEEKQVKERMAGLQKDIARLKGMLKATFSQTGKLKILTSISELRDKYFQ